MAKALKVAAVVVGVAALAVVTGGAALGLGLSLSTTLFVGGAYISAGALALGAAALSVGAALLTKSPTIPSSQTERLVASIDPRAFRKTVLGQTAMATDIRYEEWSGSDQEYLDWIICLASHAIDGVEEIWQDQEMLWSATTGVTAKYAGYFSVPNIVLEGSPANAFTFGSGQWNASTARLTGCAYLRLRFKTTGNGKKATSPFSSGISTRLTIIGRGAKLYDPRRDSTVPGGSGPMRVNDQSTWRYTADDGTVIGENLALQIHRVVLGWRITNPVTGEKRLATGSGVPGRRVDMVALQVAANLCDELVNRSAGGQEPRYHGAGVVSEGDDPKTVLDALCAACCGRFRDTGGKLALVIAHNDLAAAAADDGLNEDDVVGPFSWDPDPTLEATPNVIRGRFVDATSASLYQLIDYPEVRIASPDGQDRIATLDLGVVESPSQAQRIARQVLQRRQYQRAFSAPFDIRAWKYTVGDVVPLTFAPLSFTRALFRVADQELGQGGTCVMTLTVEHQQIYAWDASDSAPVLAADPIIYDKGNNPLILAIGEAATTALWSAVEDDDGNRPEDGATVGAPAGTIVGDRLAEQIAADLDLNALSVLAEQTLAGTWRAGSDQLLYAADGSPIRTVVEQLGTTVNGHTLFVTSLQAVDSSAGTSKFLFAARADGTIVGIEGVAGGGFDLLAFMASRFSFVDNNGGNPIQALSYENGVWKLKAIEVDTLKADTVETKHLVTSSVQQTRYTVLGSDVPCPVNANILVMSVAITKHEADSVLRVQASAGFWSTDDLQFTPSFVVDGTTAFTAHQQNIKFSESNSAGKMSIAPVLILPGIAAGDHVISFYVTNVEGTGDLLTVKAGSLLEVIEVKKAAL